jgi:YidC/Oxa1 family membrane protein insertase
VSHSAFADFRVATHSVTTDTIPSHGHKAAFMERRVLIAVFLSFLVLYAYQAYFVPPQPATTSDSATASQPTQVAPQSQTAAAETAPVPMPAPAPAVAVVEGESVEREITVETTTVQAVLSNRGAKVLHWRLKAHLDEKGQPVDLVPTGVPVNRGSPFELQVDDEAITTRLNEGLYRVSGDGGGRVDATSTASALVFEFQDASGLRVRKEFAFDPLGYIVRFSAAVNVGDRPVNPTVLWGPGLGDVGARSGGGSFFTGNYVQPPQAILERAGSVERIALSSLAEEGRPSGEFKFVGVDDHYFLASALAPGQTQATFTSLTLNDSDNTQRQFATMALRFAESPQAVRFFIGPKQFDMLRAVDQDLIRAINFGMFAWLVIPLLNALTWIHSYVGNYGLAIIVLTVVINLIIFPLRHKTVVSMRKMQVLQPQLKAIQDRYAGLKVTDPARQKMNTEVMNLYKERGVNPASGCVPMLLTMPVLFAFYSLLSQAIELRGAPFAFWIHDLSLHDPYYVTPLLMGASMFWQQRITPSTADPAQQRIMLFMPIVFTAMFLQFPSGLAIYYFTSNLWTIGQQYFTNWWIGPLAVQTVRPAAERRLKNAGAGRTADADRKN